MGHTLQDLEIAYNVVIRKIKSLQITDNTLSDENIRLNNLKLKGWSNLLAKIEKEQQEMITALFNN